MEKGVKSGRFCEDLFYRLSDELEKRYLQFVLEKTGGNRTHAAEIMQIDRRTLYRMAERFGIALG